MKLIFKAFLLLTVVTFTGCEDFLTVLPDSSYSEAGGYKTQTDFEQAIAGVYAAHQSMYQSNVNGTIYMDMLRSDECNVIIPQASAGYLGGIERFIDDANNSTHAGNYSSYYIIINRSNIILEKIDAVTFTDENAKKYIKGEALAFRAYSYWMLGWQFGGVPLIKKITSVDETKTIARSTQTETFAYAAENFNNAIALLPTVKWTGKNIGRLTKYSAMGILSRMYLFQKDYAKAKTLLSDIINSGLYGMEADYKNCFAESKENGMERLWEVQFMGGQLGEGQQFTTGMLPQDYVGTIQPFTGYSSAPMITTDLAAAYESGDLRKEISCVTNIKWNGALDTKNYFIRKYHYADVTTPKVANDWGVNLPVIRYTDVKMMYAEVLNETAFSNSGEAIAILNSVRTRAGLTPLTTVQVPDQASFRNAIIKERRVEFAFEGLRWPDLVRWGIAMDVINTKLSNPVQDGGTFRMKATQVLFPIPFDELNRYQDTKVLWQNPGY
ncbi:MAG: RagB/SusD family nutrient uptake outer membrane protein [Mariniphaga sp.]